MAETSRIGRFPAWVAEAVVYQVFPDRFRRSGRVEAQQGLALQPWGTDPAEQGFQGGDLYGVIDCSSRLIARRWLSQIAVGLCSTQPSAG